MMRLSHAPRGWNSWDCYGAAVDEATVRANAAYMSQHLKQSGYEYVVVDIQWSEPTAENHAYHPFAPLCMDAYGRLIPAENRFPSAAGGMGFRPLADYVHSLGLKFGIHIMRGVPRQAVHDACPVLSSEKTCREIAKTDSICAWNSDMYGVDPEKDAAREYYNSIFRLYAEWGVDFIKCDDIARELPACETELRLLSECLQNCGRDMVLSLSPGASLPEKAELYKQTANMWRMSDDFWDKWDALYEMFGFAEKWCIHAGAGHYPDADMLPIGAILQDYDPSIRSKFSPDELKTMMTLWCMIRSPLFIGGELTKLTADELALLTNPDVLKMHADARFTKPVYRRRINETECAVWLAADANGTYYIGVFNLGDVPAACLCVAAYELELETLRATELWTGEMQSGTELVMRELPPHGCALWKITEKS